MSRSKSSNPSPSQGPKRTAGKSPPVELGYVEETDSWRLESYFFPSKVGGRPAWLNFKPIPTPEMIRCGVCGANCVFLLQVYAPLESEASTFHRMLYVFVCRNPQCCFASKADNFVVLRCQLPRENEFYSSEPLSMDEFEAETANRDELPSAVQETKKRQDAYTMDKICALCACAADKQCGQCKRVYYCCKAHQELDWKSGGHKETCGQLSDGNEPRPGKRNPLAFREMELVTETEYYIEKRTKERTEGDRLKAYEDYVQEHKNQGGNINGMTEESIQHLEAIAKSADKDFKMFRRRVEQNPEQVLRYQRGGMPLWVNGASAPVDKAVPACSLCGAPRIFEFQIMPHLLSYLDVDTLEKSLDWATVAVYTCRDSCDVPDHGYASEWLWKQDFDE